MRVMQIATVVVARWSTWRMGIGFFLIATTLAGAAGAGRSLFAQEASLTAETKIVDNFPSHLAFSGVVTDDVEVESAVLVYRVLPEGSLTRLGTDVSVGAVTRLSARVSTNEERAYLPPGADVEWWWEVTTPGGDILETAPILFRYEDPRYQWKSLQEGNLIVYYYGDDDTARELLRVGADAIERMTALLEIELPFPAKLYVWDGVSDAIGVEFGRSETFEEQTVTGGTRVLADLIHIFEPRRWVVAHELTHILTKIAGEGGIGRLPSWLDEGTATYAEGNWRTSGSTRGPALTSAIDNDALLSLRGMASPANVASAVDLFYGQAAGIVTYLIDERGPERFAELFRVFKRGSTADNALTEVYGLTRDTLEDRYRVSVGLEPRVRGEDASTTVEDELIETPSVSESEVEESGSDRGDEVVVPRSEEEIAARQAEIDRRFATRRVAAPFSGGGNFPWDAVVTGISAGALLLGLALLWLLLGQSSVLPLRVAQAGEAPRGPSPPGDADAWSGWERLSAAPDDPAAKDRAAD